MRRTAIPSCLVVGVLSVATSVNANLISNPGFSAGGSAWSRNARTEVGSWADSDGNCAYVPSMSAGGGQIWQYIPAWKLPSTNANLAYWDARKKWYGQNNTATINLYGLKTSAAITGGASPGGANGVDYEMLAGAGSLAMGNGFWWSTEGVKWQITNPTRGRFPQGLLLSVSWGGGGTYGAGFDNFVLQAYSSSYKGHMAGDPIVGTSTGTPYQSAASVSLAYTGVGINSPIWIDPDWAVGYEYEITTNEWANSFKAIELVPIGDGLFDLDVWDTATTDWLEVATDVAAGTVNFSTVAPGRSVKKFRVRGIEPEAELDPDGHGFPIGLIFTNGGWSHTITMTAVVPEPATFWLLSLAGLALRRTKG